MYLPFACVVGIYIDNVVYLHTALPEDPGRDCVGDWVSTALEVLQSVAVEKEGEEGGEEGESGLACVGMACVHTKQGKWRDVCELLEKGNFPKLQLKPDLQCSSLLLCAGLSLSPTKYEVYLLLSWACLRLHHFTRALQHAHTGLVHTI